MNASATTRASVLLTVALVMTGAAAAQGGYHDNVVIVLDGSGSMDTRMRSTGVTRMQAAKAALKEVLSRVPDSTHVGLAVFSGGNMPGNEWAYPLGPRDDARLVAAIDLVRPAGGTPLGFYIKIGADRLLEEREKQFGYGSYRLLVVTDGEAQDRKLVERYTPEVVARGITVDVIGVDMETRHTLATKVHSYRSADDPSSLREAIAEVFAEVASTGDDAADQDMFDELAGFPDAAASAAVAALAKSGNWPIGEAPLAKRPVPLARRGGGATGPGPYRPPVSPRVGLASGGPIYLIIAGVLVAAGLVLVYYGVRAAKTSKLIKDMPTTPIGEIRRSGHVEIKGVIEPANKALESPYTLTPCVYYEFKVTEGSGDGRRAIVNERRFARTTVRDQSGACEVNLPGARLILDQTVHGSSGIMSDAPAHVEERLKTRYGRSTKGWIFNRSMTFTETVMGVGASVYVLGRARVAKDGTVRISKRDGVFIVSDKPEWDLVATLNFRMTAFLVGAAACGGVAAWLIGAAFV